MCPGEAGGGGSSWTLQKLKMYFVMQSSRSLVQQGSKSPVLYAQPSEQPGASFMKRRLLQCVVRIQPFLPINLITPLSVDVGLGQSRTERLTSYSFEKRCAAP